MFSTNRHFPKNGKQSQVYSESVISSGLRSHNIHHPTPSKKQMEKLIVHTLLASGFGAYIWAIFLNIGTWKADLLFLFSLLFIVVRFLRYCTKTWQDFRKDEIVIRKMKKEESER